MRGNIIEELYYGNIDPQDRGYCPKSPVKKVSDSLNDLEEKLIVLIKCKPNPFKNKQCVVKEAIRCLYLSIKFFCFCPHICCHLKLF